MSKRRGFTLIELLVVAAILAALATLLLPQIFQAQKRAAVAQAKSELSSLEKALFMFKEDTGGYPPTTTSVEQWNNYLVKNISPATSGWDGPYVDQDIRPDPFGLPYLFYNYFAGQTDSGNYSCVASTGPNKLWESNLFTRTVGGDDIVFWME